MSTPLPHEAYAAALAGLPRMTPLRLSVLLRHLAPDEAFAVASGRDSAVAGSMVSKLLGDAELRGIKDGSWVRLASRSGDTTLRATLTDRVNPGVVYTTFHHPDTQANVITTDYSDWATNCPEYKVTAVQISPSNGPSEWQEDYAAQARMSRRILSAAE